VNLVYSYTASWQFADAASKEGFPFRALDSGENLQPGDVLHFPGHIAIYAGQDAAGDDTMWTAVSGHDREYKLMKVKYWGKKPDAYYRYQVPTPEGVQNEGGSGQ
jgi:hypothetical protein